MNVTTDGSTPPERVPIIKPSRGVKPIDVSITLPWSTAAIDEPLPRWQVIILRSLMSLPILSATLCDTNLCEVPWKP